MLRVDVAEANRLKELRRIFLDYKALEGEEVTVQQPLGAAEALATLAAAVALYRERESDLRRGNYPKK